MLSTKELMKKACSEFVKVFGKEYLQKNYEKTLEGHGIVGDDKFMMFLGLKDSEDLPDREANDKGWVVYGKVLLDAYTGELKEFEYALE